MEDRLKKIQQIRACKGTDYKRIIITSKDQESVLNRLKNLGEIEADILKDYEFIEQFQITGKNIKNGKLDYQSFIITSQPDLPSYLDKGEEFILRFKYQGVRDGRNRNFCAEVLDLNLLYRREDIDMLTLTEANPEFGSYDIWRFAGSYGCRHNWFAQIYRRVANPATSDKTAPVIEGIVKKRNDNK